MNAVLIVAYPDKIAEDQAWLDAQIAYLQTVYNMFKAIDILVTVPELNNIIGTCTMSNVSMDTTKPNYFLDDFVIDKMIAKTGAPTFNGVPIKREAIRDMINIPDTSSISTWIISNPIVIPFNAGKGRLPGRIQSDLLEVVADVIQRKATTNALIEANHTFYTQNDKGVQTYNLLMDLNASIEAFNQNLANLKIAGQPIPRYAMINTPGGYRPDVQFIRNNEAQYPANYVAG